MTNMLKYSFVILTVFWLPQVFCDVTNEDEGKQLGTVVAPGLGGLLGSLTGGLVGSLLQGGIRNVTSSITTAAGPVLGPVLGSVVGGLLGNLLGVSQRLGPLDDDITVWGGVLPGGGTGFGGIAARKNDSDEHELPIKHSIYLPPAYLLNLITRPSFYSSGYRKANQQGLHENVTLKQNTSEAMPTEKATTTEQNSTTLTTKTTYSTTETDVHSTTIRPTTHSVEPTIPALNNEVDRKPPEKEGSANWSPYPSHETGQYHISGDSEHYLITPKPQRRRTTMDYRRPVTTTENPPTRVYHYHQDEDFYDDCDDW